jgi:hypothetical protein
MQAAISKHDSASLTNIEPFVNAVDNSSSNSNVSVHQQPKTTIPRMRRNWFYGLSPNGWPKSVLANRVAISYARDEGPSFRPKTHCGEVLLLLSLASTQEAVTP